MERNGTRIGTDAAMTPDERAACGCIDCDEHAGR